MRDEIKKFHETVDILVKAYLNDTLQHRRCEACAVGNLIRANGYPIERDDIHDTETYWLRYINNELRGHKPSEFRDYDREVAIKQINATGYTPKEVSIIEEAFEDGWRLNDTIDESMFRGLMNVVDALAEIHGIDLATKKEAKALFVK